MTGGAGSFDGDRNKSKYNIQTGEKVKINLRAMTKAAIERLLKKATLKRHPQNGQSNFL